VDDIWFQPNNYAEYFPSLAHSLFQTLISYSNNGANVHPLFALIPGYDLRLIPSRPQRPVLFLAGDFWRDYILLPLVRSPTSPSGASAGRIGPRLFIGESSRPIATRVGEGPFIGSWMEAATSVPGLPSLFFGRSPSPCPAVRLVRDFYAGSPACCSVFRHEGSILAVLLFLLFGWVIRAPATVYKSLVPAHFAPPPGLEVASRGLL